MSSIKPITNGRSRRRTLSDELDRLDTILDGLAEALDGAVADSVRHAVETAAREALDGIVRDLTAGQAETSPTSVGGASWLGRAARGLIAAGERTVGTTARAAVMTGRRAGLLARRVKDRPASLGWGAGAAGLACVLGAPPVAAVGGAAMVLIGILAAAGDRDLAPDGPADEAPARG